MMQPANFLFENARVFTAWPGVTQNPWRGVSNAVKHLPWAEGLMHQNQTLTHTFIAYTRDAARGEIREHPKGWIMEGYPADLSMRPKNLFESPSEERADLKPASTRVDGRVVCEA